jgi:hypothetical protein
LTLSTLLWPAALVAVLVEALVVALEDLGHQRLRVIEA